MGEKTIPLGRISSPEPVAIGDDVIERAQQAAELITLIRGEDLALAKKALTERLAGLGALDLKASETLDAAQVRQIYNDRLMANQALGWFVRKHGEQGLSASQKNQYNRLKFLLSEEAGSCAKN